MSIKYPLPHKLQVVFDLETTDTVLAGLRGGFPSICEVGALLVDSEYEIVSELSFFVRPQTLDEYSEFCEVMTKTTFETLIQAKYWDTMWREFAEFTKYQSYTLIAWGAGFDYSVLKTNYFTNKITYPHKHPMIDALSFVFLKSSELGIKFPSYSLSGVCERLDIVPEEEHKALSGAKKTLEVLQTLAAL